MVVLLALSGCPETAATPAPTAWYPTIQTLVNDQCADCHRSGGDAPFPLDTYAAAAPNAAWMLSAMESGAMPPWHADPDCRHYEGERVLDPADLDTFRAWVDAGAPEGDAALDQPYVAPASATWEPTWTVSVPGYLPSDQSLDDWRCFLFPELTFPDETWIVATDVTPGTASVHHALVYALEPEQIPPAEAFDAEDEAAGYTCFGGPIPTDAVTSLASLGGGTGGFPNQLAAWVPGISAVPRADGSAIQVAPGSMVVMQVHYNFQTAVPEPDTTTLSMLETDEQPTTLRKTTALLYYDLDIPANDPEVSFTSTTPYYGSEPLDLVGFTGHMHQLGSSIRSRAWNDAGDETCLVDIPAWDFHWQQHYGLALEDAVHLGSGTRLDLTCTYDNSQANQPEVDGVQQTATDVTWGESSTDEMCLLYIERIQPYTPIVETGDEPCAATEDCMLTCTGSETECLLECEATDTACMTCAMGEVATCATRCVAPLAAEQDCVRSCLLGNVLLAGNLGSCLEAECPEAYASFTTCLDEELAEGACVDGLAACGVAL